jgi:hypothetical protein
MSFELVGKLIAVYDTVQRSESFRTREFVIEKTDVIGGRTITNYVKFQCVQDKTALPDRFKLGDEVKVFFNLKGSKWEKNGNTNYITNLDAWRMELTSMSQGNADASSQLPPADFYPDQGGATENDLPF